MADDRRAGLGLAPLVLAALVVVLDQATKVYIRAHFVAEQDRFAVIPNFFDIVHVRNSGAAWGMLSSRTMLLTAISSVMLVLIVVFRRAILDNSVLHRVVFALLVGGIIGNLIDRIKLGHVTDFLDFYIGDRHWPAFNVADSAICVAVGLYLFSSFRQPKPATQPIDETA